MAAVTPAVVCEPKAKTHGECFCVSFHDDMSLLAAGYADGTVLCYEPSTGKTLYTLDPKSTLPTTCVRFRPQKATSKTRNVLVSGGANGCLQHWHVTSQKCLHLIEEEDDELVLNKDGNTTTKRHYRNQIFTMEYNHDGTRFATAGKDYKVRLYDEATKSPILSMSRGFGKMTPGHSNRVFSVKFHPTDENIMLSAGWDNTVQIWDVRVEGAVRNIFGPHICGDSMDIDCDGGVIATGSWRPEEQLQTWDYGTGSLIETFDWPVGVATREPCMVYATQFSPDGTHIAAGGSGANEVRVFNRKTGECVANMSNLSSGVYSLDWAPTCDKLVCALSDGSCPIIDFGPDVMSGGMLGGAV